MHTALRTLSVLTDTIFPRTCVMCGRSDSSLCETCLQECTLLLKQRCIICESISEYGKTCKKCRVSTHLHSVLAATYFEDGPTKEALHTLKYHSRKDLAGATTVLLQRNEDLDRYLISLSTSFVIVPVPLYRSRLWKRGFNQSTLIAHEVATRYGFSLAEKSLKRIRPTRAQATLNRKERLQNLEGSFYAHSYLVKNKKVLLVDDIATTGATLSACAKAVKEAGAKQVMAIVIARAL